MYLSVNFYDKVLGIINNLAIIDNDNSFTNDSINIGNEFIKNEDYIKRDKIKNVCVTDVIEILMNETYGYDSMRNQDLSLSSCTKTQCIIFVKA